MNDPRRTERFSPPPSASGPAGPQGSGFPPPADPAYADQAGPYAPIYGGYSPQWASSLNETKQPPPYWRQEVPPSGELPPEGLAPPPPGGPRSPRWLWIGAGAAALLVVALVVALILANHAIKTQTAVPPLPAMPEPSTETPTPSTRTSPPSHTLRPLPPPSESLEPTETTGPAILQDVVYNVTGDGRALSIMYVGTGDVIQTEFNVALPWSKEVTLSKSAIHPATVTVVNFGHNVTCSITVAGVQVSQRDGVGLTICDARG
jgi:Mycobacterium membrane protein